MQRPSGRPPHPAGFTVIELIIVLLITGIVSTIALPRILPERTAAERGATVLASALTLAQRLAVEQQCNVIVGFDEAEAALRLHVDADHDGAVGPGERVTRVALGEDVRVVRVTFDPGVSGLPEVTFHRNGSASSAGSTELSGRSDAPEEGRRVALTRATGRVSLYRFAGGDWEPAEVRP